MNLAGSPPLDAHPAPRALTGALAEESRALVAIGPVLRHLVAGETSPLLGEEPVARTRGMVESLALALLGPLGEERIAALGKAMADRLFDRPGLLAHCHALAIEGQMVNRLAERGIDPLLPPLVQARISAADPAAAALAMALMAAQTRFLRQQQRMELAIGELPGELLHECFAALRAVAGAAGGAAEAALRDQFDERRGRHALLAQLGLGLGDDFTAGLDPAQAGFSLFVTAVSLLTGHERNAVILAAGHGQHLRFALLLAVAGLEPAAREAVLLCLHPDATLPPDWLRVSAAEAGDLLQEAPAG